jgi:hypothetical protein
MIFAEAAGQIFQVAFVTDDIERSARHFAETARIGPWYFVESMKLPTSRHRGSSTPDLELAVAWAYCGTMMYEVVAQRDAGPSVYRDAVTDSGGYGLHHFAYLAPEFDREVSRLRSQGFEAAFEVKLGPEFHGKRVSYVDTRRSIGAMLEICEPCEPMQHMFKVMHTASAGWDGRDPFRPFSALPL